MAAFPISLILTGTIPAQYDVRWDRDVYRTSHLDDDALYSGNVSFVVSDDPQRFHNVFVVRIDRAGLAERDKELDVVTASVIVAEHGTDSRLPADERRALRRGPEAIQRPPRDRHGFI